MRFHFLIAGMTSVCIGVAIVTFSKTSEGLDYNQNTAVSGVMKNGFIATNVSILNEAVDAILEVPTLNQIPLIYWYRGLKHRFDGGIRNHESTTCVGAGGFYRAQWNEVVIRLVGAGVSQFPVVLIFSTLAALFPLFLKFQI